MKTKYSSTVELSRERSDPRFRSEPGQREGVFMIPHYRINNYTIRVIVGTGMGWEHISVTVGEKNKYPKRCPTWEEMCWVKDQIWDEEEAVMQLHPPKSHYVNNHEFCLHLWKPINQPIPLPDPIQVGFKELGTLKHP